MEYLLKCIKNIFLLTIVYIIKMKFGRSKPHILKMFGPIWLIISSKMFVIIRMRFLGKDKSGKVSEKLENMKGFFSMRYFNI